MDVTQLISLSMLAVFLFISMLLYLRLARRFSIMDIPNERSSHAVAVIRGGGIVFVLAALLWGLTYPLASPWFVAGAVLVGLIGFWDDIRSLSWICRISVQTLSILLALFALGVLQFGAPVSVYPWWAIAIFVFVGVGMLNAYNFMDGINGMIGLYSTVVLASLWYVNYSYFTFVQDELILYPLIASLIFLLFNFRSKAVCFSGDVGALVLAYWTFFLILLLCLQSGTFVWFGFAIIFGVDTGLTIMHRLIIREKIWNAHRLHLFQVLANEMKVPQLLVSGIYSILQLVINLVIIQYWSQYAWWMILVVLFVPLAAIYFYKFRFLRHRVK